MNRSKRTNSSRRLSKIGPGWLLVRLLRLLLVLVVIVASRSAVAESQHVVVISIDGFAWETYWQNPRVKIPTIRAVASKGVVGPMEVAFPSVTWVSHVSMVTGAFPREHGVLGNSVLNRDLGLTQNFIGDDIFNAEVVRVDTIYDLIKKADEENITAALSWPLTRRSRNLDYIVPESYSLATYIAESKPAGFLDELRKKTLLPVDRWGSWSALPASYRQDWLTAEAANYLIRTKKPNLLLIHFLVTDSFSHLYGSGSEEAIWAHEYVDTLIRKILDTLQAERILDETTLFIVSDHGFTNVRKSIKPNVALKLNGFIQVDKDGAVIQKDAISVMNHGAGFVYVLDQARKQDIVQKIKPQLAALEGVEAVYGVEDFDRLGLPAPENNSHMPDLVLLAHPSYMITDAIDGVSPIDVAAYAGTHGHDPHDPSMTATFIASGPHIQRGTKINDVTIRDIAPTVASIFGVRMPSSWPGRGGKYREGRELTEIFTK